MKKRPSSFLIWVLFYFAAFLLLGLTAPMHTKADNWSGVMPAYLIVLVGGFLLARGGSSITSVALFGCCSSLLFVGRYLVMLRLTSYPEHRSLLYVVVIPSVILVVIGTTSAYVAYFVQESGLREDW